MSRTGRAIDLLSQWRDHPKGCTEPHGFRDGYDGPCTDDPWDVAQSLDMIDPFHRQDETLRLRKVLELVAPAALAAYDTWNQSPPWDKDPAGPPLDVWTVDHALTWREQWDQLYPEAQQAWVGHAKHGLLRLALEQGATITGFSDVQPHRDQDPFMRVVTLEPMLAIQATGWCVRPETVPES